VALRRTLPGVVAIVAALAAPAALASTAAAADARRVELVRQPIAVYGREAGQPIYFVFLRLHPAVPRNSDGSPAAAVRLGGLGLSQPPTSSSMGFLTAPAGQGRHCYEQQLVLSQGPYPPTLARPRPGLRLSVEVLVRGLAKPLTATVTLRRRISPASGARPYVRELGCVRSS
jgi:hypothetical protein